MPSDHRGGESFEIDALILDMDGVLWRGDEAIGNPAELFQLIEHAGWQVTLVTNNSTRSVEQYQDKLAGMGVELHRDQILNSAYATSCYLGDRYPQGVPVYILGEEGLHMTLAEAGFEHDPGRAQVVVVGLDRRVDYRKIQEASTLIRGGAPFIGTNPDKTIPTPKGLYPGAGSILAAVEAASGTAPIIIGKPSPEMFRQALDRMQTVETRTLVVGDRLETDIAGGQAVGCRTALVFSGVTGADQADRWEPRPDLTAANLTQLLARLSDPGLLDQPHKGRAAA